MKNCLLLFASIFLLNGPGHSQSKNTFELSWGYGHLSRQDLSFSPMIHQKWSPVNLYAAYERNGNKLTHSVQAKFDIYSPSITEPFEFYWDEPNETETSYSHSFKQLEVNYQLLFPLYTSEKLKIRAGGRQRNRLIASDYLYAISSSFSYYFSFGLDAGIRAEYQPNEKNKFKASINALLFSFNSRSPYLGFDDKYLEDNYDHKAFKAFLNYVGNARFQSYSKAQDFDFSLSYERSLSNNWSILANYYLGLSFNQSPTNYSSIQNIFSLGGKLKF